MHGGLTARQWWNRLKDYNPHIAKRYANERPRLTAKQIAGLQNTGKLIGKVNTPRTNGKCTNGKCTKPTKAKATKAKATKPTKAKATKATKAKVTKAEAAFKAYMNTLSAKQVALIRQILGGDVWRW